MFVSIGQDVSDFQSALQTTHCHLQINNVGMNKSPLPARIMFYRFPCLTLLGCWISKISVKNLLSLNKIRNSKVPVSYVACVKLELVIISQQSLLNMIEIHWLAVDEDEPHTSLEGRSRVLTVHGGTAWVEETHVATVY